MELENLSEDDKNLIRRVLHSSNGKRCLRVVLQGALDCSNPKTAKFERVRELLRIVSDELHEIEEMGGEIPSSLERLWCEVTLYLEGFYEGHK